MRCTRLSPGWWSVSPPPGRPCPAPTASVLRAAAAAYDEGEATRQPEDDPDAEDAGVVGLEVVKRILGAQVIEEVTVTQEGR